MLQEKILKTIQKYNLIQKNDKIVIGVSGGPDSMCLLDSLYCIKEKLQIEVAVAHINHMIREEADSETAYVEEYCRIKEIPCFVKKVDVIELARQQKLGTEEMGRKIRYEFFEEVALKMKANKIATAHNSNDNSETVLMNFLRGSGVSGLKGIEPKRDSTIIENQQENFNKKGIKNNLEYTLQYIRPIRECTRKEIEEYCEQRKLSPKIDKSNFENIYTRNKIRNLLIPYLQKEFNSNIIETLNRLSEIAQEEEEYFTKIIQETYENLKIGKNEKADNLQYNEKVSVESQQENQSQIILDLKKFNQLPKVIKEKLLFYTINKTIGTTQGIEKVHIKDIIKLCENNIGNKYLTPNKNIKIFVQKGKIFFYSQKS